LKALLLAAVLTSSFLVSTAFSDASSGPFTGVCDQKEIQFFGIVRNIKQVNTPAAMVCTFQVQLVSSPMEPKPNPNCPLSEVEAEQLTFVDVFCGKKAGEAVSGVMVYKNGQASIE
jgi:hypothetical protein